MSVERIETILDRLIHDYREVEKHKKVSRDLSISREFYSLMIETKIPDYLKPKVLKLKGIQFVINYSQNEEYKFVI